MELSIMIQGLNAQKERLERVIAELEKLQRSGSDAELSGPVRRRGRISMGEAERRQVSERMKAYWAARRK